MRAERGNEACLIVEPGKGVPLQDEPIGDCNFAAAVVRKLRGYAGKHLPAHRLSRELQEDAKNDVDLKTLLQEFHRPSPSPVSVDALDDRPPRLIRSSSYAMLSKSSIHVAFGFALEFSVDSPDPPQSFQLVVFLAHPETPYFRTVQDPLWAPQRSGKDVLNLLFCNAPGPGSIEGPSSAPAAAPLPPGNVPPLTGTMMPPIQDSEQVVEDFFNMLTNLENTVWAPPSSDSNMSYLGTDH
ncbi:hypothetical protein OC834_006053 [Tilletia horrida]|uniref:Uncharacterized protein n=1 Tax=Tilletia horrida TaxID=155126 RepID=A0AAN6JLN3_9BASI|nr:hypothetical protein OC834_006053 [Tilletia horrida]KAK0524599.1 hypothetical protein OC835_005871 [Tilletia horrida]KAK0535110.1 hypothetical protein OC842_002412 [Tilletia horrida]